MNKLNPVLTTRQLLAITKIIESGTMEEACKKVRVNKSTVYSWLREENFKVELRNQRNLIIQEAQDRLKSAMIKAVEGLIMLMNDPSPDMRKRLIYKDVIEFGQRAIELEDLGERLDKVERIILERKTYK